MLLKMARSFHCLVRAADYQYIDVSLISLNIPAAGISTKFLKLYLFYCRSTMVKDVSGRFTTSNAALPSVGTVDPVCHCDGPIERRRQIADRATIGGRFTHQCQYRSESLHRAGAQRRGGNAARRGHVCHCAAK